MTRLINGVTYYSSSEMAELKGGNTEIWSHFARTGKVPAVKWIDTKWYFNPQEVDKCAVANRYYTQLERSNKGNEIR